jgi:hypothetical protein
MGKAARLEEVFDRQYEDYRSMYQLGLEQRSCIAGEDLAGLDASFGRMHRVMDRIRLRQTDLDELCSGGVPAGVAERREALRTIVVELQELRRVNERAVRQLQGRTREELKQVQQGRRAARGYRHSKVEQARFFDGTR